MNNRLFQSLSVKPFLFLWLAELFSQLGFSMMNFILIVVVYALTSSNTAVAGIVLSFTIPAIVFGLLAGVYVDRWNKKTVLFSANILRAILLFGLYLFHTNVPIVFIISFAIAVVTQFFIPAETAMIPNLVKKHSLLSANALFGMGIYGSMVVAYALSGPFLIFFGRKDVFILLALFFVLASFFISFIRVPSERALPEDSDSPVLGGVGEEIKSVFSIIKRTKEIYNSLFLLTLSQIVILILAVIGPGYAREILKVGVERFPLLFITPAAIGMIFGAVVVTSFFHKQPRERSVNIGLFLSSFAILLMPYISKVSSYHFIIVINSVLPSFFAITFLHIILILAFLLGFSNALIFVPSNTILQEKTAEEFRGKVYGALNALAGIFSLLPIILVGFLSDIIGIASVITGIGIFILGIGTLRVLFALKR